MGVCTAGFYEERAILLGKQGRHEEALAIYVHVLHDNRMAEEYVDIAVISVIIITVITCSYFNPVE